jgi:uncharacterized membrane protein YdjX (TVP38/TMEM64 family)
MDTLRKYWRWIAALLVIAALFTAARLLPLAEWLTAFSEWAGNLGALGFVLFVLMYVLATILFVPGWPLTVGAGFTFGLVLGTAAVSIGSVLGAAAAFLIARFFAREQIEARTKENKKFRAIDRAIGEQGWKLIFLLRLSPVVPFNLSNYFYGITAVNSGPTCSPAGSACCPAPSSMFTSALSARPACRPQREAKAAPPGNGWRWGSD